MSLKDAHPARLLGPFALIAVLLLLWQFGVSRQPAHLLPTPLDVVSGIGELASSGLLIKHVVASLFRVTWGFTLAVLIAIPCGLAIGWYRRAEMAPTRDCGFSVS